MKHFFLEKFSPKYGCTLKFKRRNYKKHRMESRRSQRVKRIDIFYLLIIIPCSNTDLDLDLEENYDWTNSVDLPCNAFRI